MAPPRPSASLVVVNAKNEVLLVHRNPNSQSYGGAQVFPGGNFDAAQDDSLAMTAIRETFEESGLLIASPPSPPVLEHRVLDAARQAVHAQKTPFKTFLAEHHLGADVPALAPFTAWITPATAPRRFHAQFFITFLPPAPRVTQDRTPTPDGGREVVAVRFARPADVLAEFRARKIMLMFPQFYILSTLSDVLRDARTTPLERERIGALAQGPFGRMVVNPLVTPAGGGQKGCVVITLEGDESRGGPKGRLHRASGLLNEAGVAIELNLLRNFDIFTEFEPRAPERSKL